MASADHAAMLRRLWSGAGFSGACPALQSNPRGRPRVHSLLGQEKPPHGCPGPSTWQRLGFQNEDPTTDFRGVGVLGLECLLYMYERPCADDVRLEVLLDDFSCSMSEDAPKQARSAPASSARGCLNKKCSLSLSRSAEIPHSFLNQVSGGSCLGKEKGRMPFISIRSPAWCPSRGGFCCDVWEL